MQQEQGLACSVDFVVDPYAVHIGILANSFVGPIPDLAFCGSGEEQQQ
jgi:hypothetical protein